MTNVVPDVQGGRSADHPRELERAARYRAYLFGHVRVFEGERRLALAGSRKKSLDILLWFLLHPGKPFPADQVVDALWPEADPDKAISYFDVSMHGLRRMLEPELGPREDSSFIRHHSNRVYTFDPADQWWTDIDDLQLLYQRGNEYETAGDLGRACYYYRRVSEYASLGPLLDGETNPRMEPFRRKYALMCSYGLARLIELGAERHEEDELLESAYRMLQVDRHSELATRVIVNAHLRRGDHRGAVHRLEAFCTTVRRDLGLPPPSEFAELQHRLRGMLASNAVSFEHPLTATVMDVRDGVPSFT